MNRARHWRDRALACYKAGPMNVTISQGRRGAVALVLLTAVACTSEPAKESQVSVESDAAIQAIDAFIAEQSIDTSNARWKTQLPQPPKVEFTDGTTYLWSLQTNVGDIKVELLPATAPMHVSSTVYLTRLGFYDDVVFHRVIPGFMAQGGDPLGRGTGGPGYQYDGEFDPGVKHDVKGVLSMANAGPGTDGSQFFLTFVPTPHLDGRHTIFGKVVDGLDTLDELEKRGSGSGQTSEKLVIQKATIALG